MGVDEKLRKVGGKENGSSNGENEENSRASSSEGFYRKILRFYT